jgi:hypothetical protein
MLTKRLLKVGGRACPHSSNRRSSPGPKPLVPRTWGASPIAAGLRNRPVRPGGRAR